MSKRAPSRKMGPIFERDRRFDEAEAVQRGQAAERARSIGEFSTEISKHIAEHMPDIRVLLERFKETGEDQRLVLSEPHPLTDALFRAVIKETRAKLEDFDDGSASQAVQEVKEFPVPQILQHELGLETPVIHAHVWDSPMAEGGILYKLDFLANTPAEDGGWEQTHNQVLIASNMELNPALVTNS